LGSCQVCGLCQKFSTLIKTKLYKLFLWRGDITIHGILTSASA
jgi:hypothetical protein